MLTASKTLSAAEGMARSGPVVLVVEDDANVREVIIWALEDEGLAIVAVADGRSAVEWLSRNRPALVLLDIGLPLVDGFGVAAALREIHGEGVPVVVMTAAMQAAYSAREVDARDFLSKPFDVDDLVRTVRRALDD